MDFAIVQYVLGHVLVQPKSNARTQLFLNGNRKCMQVVISLEHRRICMLPGDTFALRTKPVENLNVTRFFCNDSKNNENEPWTPFWNVLQGHPADDMVDSGPSGAFS